MYPGHWAEIKPLAPAIIHAGTGESVLWAELNAQSNQIAQRLRAQGLTAGDHVALMMENQLGFFAIAWAAFRSGLYITCINRYLTPEEAAYIVNDCGAQVFITSQALTETATAMLPMIGSCTAWMAMEDGVRPASGFTDLGAELKGMPTTPLADEPMGDSMLYSSGTTGQPKGIKRPLTGRSVQEGIPGLEVASPYEFTDDSRYLSPAPLYHAAPFGFCMRILAYGGTVVMMERFDPEAALGAIEQFGITHSQWVPTMFVRLLKLDAQVRDRYNLTSHRCAVHAAAPCPPEVKQRMIDWWGPILWEYYAGTERNGSTLIDSAEWLTHPGSVGRARSGVLRICDEQGRELGPGQEGVIYFEQPTRPFAYHNDNSKTAAATHPLHSNWTALGDIGYVDEDGYLYLTDRKAYLIIAGGVNIYPREIEDALIVHPMVADVAVFGIPHPEFGESVHAVVQPADGVAGDAQLVATLQAFAREHLAAFKVPRSIDFTPELPRLPTGKLYKRLLKDPYWAKTPVGST